MDDGRKSSARPSGAAAFRNSARGTPSALRAAVPACRGLPSRSLACSRRLPQSPGTTAVIAQGIMPMSRQRERAGVPDVTGALLPDHKKSSPANFMVLLTHRRDPWPPGRPGAGGRGATQRIAQPVTSWLLCRCRPKRHCSPEADIPSVPLAKLAPVAKTKRWSWFV